jgi:hypothetical protein
MNTNLVTPAKAEVDLWTGGYLANRIPAFAEMVKFGMNLFSEHEHKCMRHY